MRFLQTLRKGAQQPTAKGFSILEMLIACAILMFGVVSVVQLVPTSLQTNVNNRLDTMATVIAQRELDQMLSQPLTVNSFTDKDNNLVMLGGAGAPGSPVIMDGPNAVIDFSQSAVPGYSISNYQDPNDPNFPNGQTFELRWAVIPEMSAGTIISKRIIVGCRRTNANQLVFPVNLDSSVQRF
jgi:type II secretory pathway pseudopilin PulG